MKKATKKLGVLCATMLCAATLVGGVTALDAAATEASNVTVSYSGDTLTGATLNKLQITSFEDTETVSEFHDYFKIAGESKVQGEHTLTVTEENTLKVAATGTVVYYLMPMPGRTYGSSELGNFEIKMTIRNVVSGAHIAFGSRAAWDSNYPFDSGARVLLNNGGSLGNFSRGTTVQEGGNRSISSTEEFTLTMGWIDNAWYWYTAEEPNVSLSNVSIAYKEYSTDASTNRNGWQTFGMEFRGGSGLEIVDFTYERLSTENSEFPYLAPTVDGKASAETVKAYLATQKAGKYATFDGNGYESGNLTAIDVPSFSDLADFTDYFQPSYNHIGTIESGAVYNATNQSVILTAPTNTQNKTTMEWRLLPDGSVDGKTGYSELGNFEVSFTLKGLNIASQKNVYFASRQTWDSSLYSEAKAALNGSASGTWGIGASGASVSAADVLAGIKFTVGYVNDYTYYYVNDNVATLTYYKDQLSVSANTDRPDRDGNQCFALALVTDTQIEISSFSYERLDKAFSATADGTEEAYILARMEKKALEAQSFEMIKGASVRMANPSGLRFAATFDQAYIDLWKAQGYTVELGVLIVPTQYITDEKGEFSLTNANYVEGTDYKRIVCTDGEYSVIDGMARLNGVLEVKAENYGVSFSGVAYIKLTKGDATTYKYAKTNENVRSIKEVATAAYNDQTKTYSDAQKAVLKQIAGITE